MIGFEVFAVGPLGVNCTIVYKNNNALVFDAGGDLNIIKEFLDKKNIENIMLVNTHGHFDHIGAIYDLKKLYNAKLYMSIKDDFLLKEAGRHAEFFGLPRVSTPTIDVDISEVDCLPNNITDVSIIQTPGHTPGGLCYYMEELQLLISGDTLFRNSIGRTDFPYCSYDELIISVRKLYSLPENTRVIPGHGPFTTIGYEKHHNPFTK
jgi:glyoxylase-like metal-dependent hydrolase (beta-lactamase superfamily II)